MTSTASTQGVYENVPAETREQLLDRFVNSRSVNPAISEEEIMDEVKAVRYVK